MRKINIIVSIIFIALAAGVFAVAATFKNPASIGSLGNNFFPNCVVVLTIALSAALLLTNLRSKAAGAGEEKVSDIFVPQKMLMPLAGFVILTLYIVLLEPVGFLLDTMLMMEAYLLLFRCKNKWFLVLVPVLGSLLIYTLFQKVFIVLLPQGIFGF